MISVPLPGGFPCIVCIKKKDLVKRKNRAYTIQILYRQRNRNIFDFNVVLFRRNFYPDSQQTNGYNLYTISGRKIFHQAGGNGGWCIFDFPLAYDGMDYMLLEPYHIIYNTLTYIIQNTEQPKSNSVD